MVKLSGFLSIYCCLSVVLLTGCAAEKSGPEVFGEVLPAESGLVFQNRLSPSDSLHILNFDYFYNGGGVAVIDLNHDSLPDLFMGGNQTPCKLFLNKGNLVFEDITAAAGITTKGWVTGIAVADVDQNGYEDIYLCYSAWADAGRRANELWLHTGNLEFTEVAQQTGLADSSYSTQAAFLDYDGDDDLDMFLMTVDINMQNPHLVRPVKTDGSGPATDKLYRNEGFGTDGLPRYVDVSKTAGICVDGYGLGLAVSDFNNDNLPDIFVANDFIYNDILYINNGDGTFADQAARAFRHTSHFSMGADAADVNNDGFMDVVTLDMEPEDNFRQKMMSGVLTYDKLADMLAEGFIPQYMRNNLHLNNHDGTFSEIGQLAGIYATEWSWSALFSDLDNDGLQDLFITNGIRRDVTDRDFAVNAIRAEMALRKQKQYSPEKLNEVLLEILDGIPGYPQHNYLFKNTNGLQFQNRSIAWGLGQKTFSSGATATDLDADGDLDLVINNIDAPAQLFRNQTSQQNRQHFIKVRLRYKGKNRQATGARLTLWQNGSQQTRQQQPVRGFQSSHGAVLHFGLGQTPRADSLVITWPDGSVQVENQITTVDTLLQVSYNADKAVPRLPAARHIPGLFSDANAEAVPAWRHQENSYIDFKAEPLLPHKFSEQGPCMAVADVNGDGLEDLFIGGAAGLAGSIFFQQANGGFLQQRVAIDTAFEDTDAVFFDADADGDPDLYVVSGGSEYPAGSQYFQDRLYLNNGKGNFTRSTDALPRVFASGSCVRVADFNADGYPDLFVGGRVVPGKYPVAPQSVLLRNSMKNGKPVFKEVTSQLAPELAETGLVTDAAWADFNGDGNTDLVLVGEWMPVTLYLQGSEGFKKQIVPDSEGWWNTIVAADFDHDGDMDCMAGNMGLNTRFKVSPAQPMEVHAKDFDQSGSFDAVLSYFIKGEKVTVQGRDKLADQMPLFRRNYKTYAEFAKQNFEDIFTGNILINTLQRKAVHFETSLLENPGNGNFILKTLPVEAQIAPIHNILVKDFNADGHTDALLAGNFYGSDVIIGRYDAFNGLLLSGNGQGTFGVVPHYQSGFKADLDARELAIISLASGRQVVLVANNQDSLQAFIWQPGIAPLP